MNRNFFIISLIAALFLPACRASNSTDQFVNSQPTNDKTSFAVPKPNVNLNALLEISEEPDDVARCEKINQTIDDSQFSNARWGVFVFDLKTGRVVCERDSRRLFNPASVHKILTSIVALDKLGADFRWQTKVFADVEIENGVLNGDLTIYGGGAPDFSEQDLETLVSRLRSKNLVKITGNIVGDESFFRGDNLGDGWAWNDAQWYYGAQASALSIDKNQTEINLENGKVVASNAFVQISGAVKPVEDIEAVGVKRELGSDQIYVWGNANNLKAKVSVNNPALQTAKMLKEALRKKGIAVEGDAKSSDWKAENKSGESEAVELASVSSATLGEIVQKMNKDSVNLYAELILRTLGKRFGDAAPDENPQIQKLRGDDAAGASVIKKWLTENQVATDEIKIHDGSGLSRLNFVTPEAFGRALIYAAQAKFADGFKNSLPVAGTDGTLRGRLDNVRRKVLAKTGSIMYVNALAGYASGANDHTFAFVILCNNQTRKENSSVVLDAIATEITEDLSEKKREKEEKPK